MYGQRLREARKACGLTQKQLAEKLFITQSAVGKYEREELQPNIPMIISICKTLDVSADYLLGLED